jgi:hypothetical protein
LLGWLVPIALLAAAALLLLRRRSQSHPSFLAHAEFWVYLPEAKMPPQDALMTRMIQQNPHGSGLIGPREGLLFSDIRLHIGLATRAKNPQLFRPDLFEPRALPTPEILRRLAESQGLAKVRYVSEVPLKDDRHLQFLAHCADSLAALGSGGVIYDVVLERLMTAEDFSSALDKNGDCTTFEGNTETWWTGEGTGIGRVTGLTKIGLPDVVTPISPSDQRVLILELIEEVARRLWMNREVPSMIEIERYGDLFQVELSPVSRDQVEARIHRFNAIEG